MKLNFPISRPFSDYCRHVAVMFDAQGKEIGSQSLKYGEKVFTYDKQSYIFDPNSSSYQKVVSLFYTTKYYFYSVGRPEPLVLKFNPENMIISSKEFGVFINTSVLTELNNLAKESLLAKLLTPLNIIIAVVIIGVIWYLQSSGKLG